MPRELRKIADPFVIAAPSGASARDRLRPTEDEAAALAEIGAFCRTRPGGR